VRPEGVHFPDRFAPPAPPTIVAQQELRPPGALWESSAATNGSGLPQPSGSSHKAAVPQFHVELLLKLVEPYGILALLAVCLADLSWGMLVEEYEIAGGVLVGLQQLQTAGGLRKLLLEL